MEKILLIEDDRELAESISAILTFSGYDVRVAVNGDKGQQSLFSFKPDLIISDVILPGMNGIELVELIRQDPRYAKLPIILLSGKTAEQDVAKGKYAGASLYLKKPCDADALITSVSELLKQAHPLFIQ